MTTFVLLVGTIVVLGRKSNVGDVEISYDSLG
jgi:hypothetical protein